MKKKELIDLVNSDCNCHCKASEYEEVTTITYKPKK